MISGVEMPQHHSGALLYARFLRRFQAMLIDYILVILVIAAALLTVSAARNDNFSRAIGILVVVAWLLYEPVLVAITGSTLGHYFVNRRVVDNRHGGNVSFLKAVVRFTIKTVLGWLSFIVITATRRNQALHDLMTRSTVQVRNPAIARSHDYIAERREFLIPTMPSRVRRIAIICVYLFLLLFIYAFVLVGAEKAGLISAACINSNNCSPGENYLFAGSALACLAISGICIGWGWRGKLLGARAHAGV
jgi:uncharacterized RDD family membrane protein YckC